MKTIKLALSTVIASVLAPLASQAAVDLSAYQKTIQQVTTLEAQENYREAAYVSMKASQEIASSIGLHQAIASITSSLNEIRQEVVTERQSVGGSFSLLGLITGHAKKSWDVTQMMTVNPKEVEGFGQKVAKDYQKLQTQMSRYVQSNEMALVYTKVFAAKALQLAGKMSYQTRSQVAHVLAQTVQQAQKMNFYGEQSVERCVTTNYADRSKTTSAGLGGLLLSLSFDLSEVQVAHQTQSCYQSTKGAQVSESSIMSAKLFQADRLITVYDQALGLKDVQEAQAPTYPTWGLPAYK